MDPAWYGWRSFLFYEHAFGFENGMAKNTKSPKGQKPNQNKEHPSEKKAEHIREMRQSFPETAKSDCCEKNINEIYL